MDWTVNSIFTTTPRFKPLEGCEPIPIICTLPSSDTSPIMVTIFDVPISIPTIKFRSGCFFAIIWIPTPQPYHLDNVDQPHRLQPLFVDQRHGDKLLQIA